MKRQGNYSQQRNNILQETPYSFTATIYTFTGCTLMGPDDEWKLWNKSGKKECQVISTNTKVDPLNKFAFVTDGIDTYTVSRSCLKQVQNVNIGWKRKPYMTAIDEVKAKLDAMNAYFLEHSKTLTAENV